MLLATGTARRLSSAEARGLRWRGSAQIILIDAFHISDHRARYKMPAKLNKWAFIDNFMARDFIADVEITNFI